MARTEDFTAFAASSGGALFRTAWLLTGDWHRAEDLVQEALGRLYVRWGRLGHVEDPTAYARTVLLRVFLSQRRKRSSGERPVEAVPDAAGAAADADLRLTLLDALGHLDRTDRAVVVLRYWHDADVASTAAALELSPGAVRMRSSRALQRLRALLGDDLGGAAPPAPTGRGRA